MRTSYLLPIGCLMAALASGCGGGGGDGGEVSDPNRVGAGWITISGPSTTDLTMAAVGGRAFVSPTHWACCTGNASDTGVTVTWSNDTTGAAGAATQIPEYGWLFQFFLLGSQRWNASIPLAMGSNVITVTATDPGGNLGRATLTVMRAPDSTPPTVVATSPTHQAQGVPVDAKLSATFSELMDPASMDVTAFVVADSNGNLLPGSVTLNANVATFDPTNLLPGSSTYTARITTAARDLAGNNALASEFVWTFSTGSSTWLATSLNGAPSLEHPFSAVSTGTGMIVWGRTYLDSVGGARYDPGSDTWQPISTAGAPSGRNSHSAVWTGSEMIVWGGTQYAPSALVNTGGRYSPATDSWVPMSTLNAPTPRTNASVIWTGTEMIVWGGSDPASSTLLNDGAAYNPLTDTWRTITTIGAPAGRAWHTAVWSGTEMIVWGGVDVSATWTNTGGRYDPATDSWQATSISSAPVGRVDHTAVWTGSHMIIWGGRGFSINPLLNTGGRYNPVTDSWQATATADAPTPRNGHSAVWTGSEMFIWGGVDTSGPPVNTGGRYNPATNQWTVLETSGAPSPRYGHSAVWTGSAMVIWGPFNSTGGRFIP